MIKPRAIIFDWDNTIIDSESITALAVNKMLSAMNYPTFTPEQMNKQAHKSGRDALPNLFGDKWQEANNFFLEAYLSNRYEHLKLMPNLICLLDYLKEQQIYLAIVSNKEGDYLREEVAYFGLEHYFTKIIGSYDALEDKPSELPVLMALEGSNITAGQDVWFIGDSVIDIECAINSKCLPIFFGEKLMDKHHKKQDIKNLQNHHDFLTFLKEILPD
jgi:phosphoglycolate phosphatase